MYACWFLNSSYLFHLLCEAKNIFIQFFLFVAWMFLETMKGLYIFCSYNENFWEW